MSEIRKRSESSGILGCSETRWVREGKSLSITTSLQCLEGLNALCFASLLKWDIVLAVSDQPGLATDRLD